MLILPFILPVLSETDEFAGPYFMRYLSKFAMDPEIVLTVPRPGLMKDYTAAHPAVNVWKSAQEINTFGGAIEKLREISCQRESDPYHHKQLKNS